MPITLSLFSGGFHQVFEDFLTISHPAGPAPVRQPFQIPPGEAAAPRGIHANIDGATVMFDNEVKGVISQGVLSVQVYTTATPYKTYTVSKDGYVPYTGSIDRYPGKGETVDLYVTMNPAPTPTSTPKSPLSPALAGGALLIVGLLLAAGRKRN